MANKNINMVDNALFSRDAHERMEYADEIFENLNPRKPQDRKLARLVARWLAFDSLEHNRWAALEILESFGTQDDIRVVKYLMTDPDPLVRASAASAIATLKHKSSERLLLSMLDDHNPYTRRYVYCGLSTLNNEKFLPLLTEKLQQDHDELATVAIYNALARSGDPSAIEKLKELAKSRDRHLSSPAQETLSELEN